MINIPYAKVTLTRPQVLHYVGNAASLSIIGVLNAADLEPFDEGITMGLPNTPNPAHSDHRVGQRPMASGKRSESDNTLRTAMTTGDLS